MSILRILQNDFYGISKKSPSLLRMLLMCLISNGWRAVLIYRFSQSVNERLGVLPARLLTSVSVWFTGAELSPLSRIAPGLVIIHPNGIVVGDGVRAGSQLTIMQGVTLGEDYKIKNRGEYPNVGDAVTLCANSSILGAISIGNSTLVGANSLVIDNLDPDSVYVGTPARKIGVVNREECYWRFFSDELTY